MSKTNTETHGRDRGTAGHLDPSSYDYNAIYATARRMRAEATWDLIAAAVKGIGRLFRFAVVDPYHRWHRREIAYKELMSMEPYMLRDLGITRGDIPYVISCRDDPRHIANENRHPEAA